MDSHNTWIRSWGAGQLYRALDSDDYVIRQEACGALGSVDGADAVARLRRMSANDFHRSVRQEARTALLRIETQDLGPAERAGQLQTLLAEEGKNTTSWALSVLATECGEPGRDILRRNAGTRSSVGRKALLYLLVQEGAGPNFRGRY
jgi:hypothetical protein